jgi:hypothetical protein
MSHRWNWDSPTPILASECAPPPGTKGWGAHSCAGEGLRPGVPIPMIGEKVKYSAYSVSLMQIRILAGKGRLKTLKK